MRNYYGIRRCKTDDGILLLVRNEHDEFMAISYMEDNRYHLHIDCDDALENIWNRLTSKEKGQLLIDNYYNKKITRISPRINLESSIFRLLNETCLCVKNNKYRICELELYYHSRDHDDRYTHRSQDQLKNQKFYFHKFKNGTYKMGTYKGLDLTFGNEDSGIYCGILIRTIMNIETGEIISGPCKCVNKILEIFDVNGVSQLVEILGENIDIYETPDFHICDYDLIVRDIYIGERIGLSDKYPEFRHAKYRWATDVKNIKQRKSMTVVYYN